MSVHPPYVKRYLLLACGHWRVASPQHMHVGMIARCDACPPLDESNPHVGPERVVEHVTVLA